MTNFSPKVSIIIPVYNGANFLREAIDSALSQTYRNTEIIVVNDGSNDNGDTEAIAVSYGSRIRYYSKPNGGVASALNMGIEKMSGEYFSWLSHDDLYCPDKVEKQIAFLGRMEDKKTILYSDFFLYIQDTKVKHKIAIDDKYNEYNLNMMIHLFASHINGCTLLIHKEIFEREGVFREDLRTTQDYQYWFKLFYAGYKFEHIKDYLIISRHHKAQDTMKLSELHIHELNNLYVWAFELFRDSFFNKLSESELGIFLKVEKDRGLIKSHNKIRALINYKISQDKSANRPIIWLYWENAGDNETPKYIEMCYKTIVNKCKNDFTIINLEPDDIEYYLPAINKDYELFNEVAHKADYLRYNLLYKYGGIWLDSDVIVLNTLKPTIYYINKHGFVCTGYKDDNNIEFPLIAFLGAKKGNIILKKVIDKIEDGYFDNLRSGIQPRWDEIGGRLLAECMRDEKYYMFDLKYFSPINIHKKDVKNIFFNKRPKKKDFKNAYMQFLPNSLLDKFFNIMNEDILKTPTLLARIFKMGLGRKEAMRIIINNELPLIKGNIKARLLKSPSLYNVVNIIYRRIRR